MTEYAGRRYLSHKVAAELDEGDRYDAEETQPWKVRKGNQRRFRVDHINWTGIDLTNDSHVFISGYAYRKDGTLGVMTVRQRVAFTTLPEHVQAGMRKAYEEVYQP